MPKINRTDVKEYLATGGNFVASLILEVYQKSVDKAGEDAFADAIEIGITNTILALYDTNVEDAENIRVLNTCWGIDRNEAEDRLIHEKRQVTLTEFRHYLKMQGLSPRAVTEFVRSNDAITKIKYNKELWEMRRNPEKLMKAVQELK